MQLRSLSSPSEIAHNEDILRIFLMACEVRTVKLSVIGLSCLQKLISHDAVAPSALKEILFTLKEVSDTLWNVYCSRYRKYLLWNSTYKMEMLNWIYNSCLTWVCEEGLPCVGGFGALKSWLSMLSVPSRLMSYCFHPQPLFFVHGWHPVGATLMHFFPPSKFRGP